MPLINSSASCILSGGPDPPAPPSARDHLGAQTTLRSTLIPCELAASSKRPIWERSACVLEPETSHHRTWILAHLKPIPERVSISALLSLFVQFNWAP